MQCTNFWTAAINISDNKVATLKFGYKQCL